MYNIFAHDFKNIEVKQIEAPEAKKLSLGGDSGKKLVTKRNYGKQYHLDLYPSKIILILSEMTLKKASPILQNLKSGSGIF